MTALRITIAVLVAAAGLLLAPAPADAGHACGVSRADRWSGFACGTAGIYQERTVYGTFGDSHTDGYCVSAYARLEYSSGHFYLGTSCTTGGAVGFWRHYPGGGRPYEIVVYKGSSPWTTGQALILCSNRKWWVPNC